MLRSTTVANTLRAFRSYSTSASASTTAAAAQAVQAAAVIPKPVKRVGAFRGGLLGFFGGVSATSLVVYYYVLDEYKNSSNVIIKDVLSLTKSIRVLEEHVKVLEQQQVPKN